jgi:hypothetical protein
MVTANQLREAAQAAELNRIETKVRSKTLAIAVPFPDELKEKAFSLQPVDRSGWHESFRAYRVKSGICKGVTILASVATYEGELWYHVSFSLRDRTPTHEQMTLLRTAIFPPHLKALHIFPPIDEHFDLHPHCLHLWANLERDPLPDFRTSGMV